MASYIVENALFLTRTGKYYPGGIKLEIGNEITQEEIDFVEQNKPSRKNAAPKTNDEAAKDPQNLPIGKIREILHEKGVSFDKRAKRAELIKLLE